MKHSSILQAGEEYWKERALRYKKELNTITILWFVMFILWLALLINTW